jgi:hypothetical protein
MRANKPPAYALYPINGFVIGNRNDYLGMKGFSLGKRRKSELADGALVARIVGVLPVRRLANSSLTFSVMMDSLHHKEGHERHEQQPCYYDSAFCLYSHFYLFIENRRKYTAFYRKSNNVSYSHFVSSV